MKIIFNLLLVSLFTIGVAAADPFTSFFNFSDKLIPESYNVVEGNNSEALAIDKKLASTTEVKSACEHFDNTSINLLTLESASADAKQKIENVEETIDSETQLRDSIFDSVKGLIGLQKKDKVIFREMRKDISSAKNYYADLDTKISDTNSYLNENICEETEEDKAAQVDQDTEDLVIDESTYRKQFVGSLKEKMKILQEGVKQVKK